MWAGLYEPRTFLAILARILPYYVNTDLPIGKGTLSYEETLVSQPFATLSLVRLGCNTPGKWP
jgi:hypothetical protein